jgi:hypothetical protein
VEVEVKAMDDEAVFVGGGVGAAANMIAPLTGLGRAGLLARLCCALFTTTTVSQCAPSTCHAARSTPRMHGERTRW